MKYYKALKDGKTCHGGNAVYHKPKGKRPGKWMPEVKDVVLCEIGYHVCTADQLISWIHDCNEVWEVEVRGNSTGAVDKSVHQQIRLIRRVMTERELLLLAADYAEHVLRFYEDKYPDDDRPRKAIEATRDYVNGKINAAARAAAGAAAGNAARAAARAAAWAAARDVAGAAAWDAAGAAGAAAGAAERQWQIDKLKEYLK